MWLPSHNQLPRTTIAKAKMVAMSHPAPGTPGGTRLGHGGTSLLCIMSLLRSYAGRFARSAAATRCAANAAAALIAIRGAVSEVSVRQRTIFGGSVGLGDPHPGQAERGKDDPARVSRSKTDQIVTPP